MTYLATAELAMTGFATAPLAILGLALTAGGAVMTRAGKLFKK